MDENTDKVEDVQPSWLRRNWQIVTLVGATVVSTVAAAAVVYTGRSKASYERGHAYGSGLGDAMTQKRLEFQALKDNGTIN